MRVDKLMIATRANQAAGKAAFFKSYIKNVKKVSEREVSDKWPGAEVPVYETDYTFDYKGKSYRVNDNRQNHFAGEYELIEL